MFCGLKRILECEKERIRTIRSSDSSSGLSPFGSLRKYMKSNKTSCPTLNTLFRDPRTYKIQPVCFKEQLSYILNTSTFYWFLDPWLPRVKTKFKFAMKTMTNSNTSVRVWLLWTNLLMVSPALNPSVIRWISLLMIT